MSLKTNVKAFLISANTIRSKVGAMLGGQFLGVRTYFEIATFKILETRSVPDPANPGQFGGTFLEHYYQSDDCVYDDPILYRVQYVANDLNNLENIIYSLGVTRVDQSDPTQQVNNPGQTIMFGDIEEDGQTFSTITVDGQDVFSGFRDTQNPADYALMQNPAGDTILRLEAGSASVNNQAISFKEHVDAPGVGKYTIERAVDGAIIQIDQYVTSTAVAGGARVVALPLVLPDADEAKITVAVAGIGPAGAIVAPKYIGGSLTTSEIQIDVFDGSAYSDDPAFIHLTWKA